jgi:hypothetical protein
MKIAIYTKALIIALHLDTHNQIKRITDAEQISMADWVQDAVYAALKKEKKDNENGFDKNRKGNEFTVNPSG